jgi:pyruvate/2-oxoglutarate dehydrogenase complex dihydrolipoamide acyltransferase (E2) component
MTTIETRFPARTEPIVFVAEDDRRARLLRYGGAALVALACLWLAGLGIGMLGLGNLPGVTLPIPGVSAERGQQSERSRDAATPVQAITAAPARSVASSARGERIRSSRSVLPQATAPQRRSAVHVGTGSQPRTGSQSGQPPAPPTPAQPTPAPAPAPMNRGWTRRGWSEPLGHASPSLAEPVRRRGEPNTAAPTMPTTTTAPIPIAPPGQQKKADEPKPTG